MKIASSFRSLATATCSAALLLALSAGACADSLTFTENYGQAQKKVAGEFEVVEAGSFNVDAVVSLEDVDIKTFDAATVVSLVIGNFTYDAVLGDDPAYRPGLKKAVFKERVPTDSVTLGKLLKPKPKVTLTISMTWTKKALTVNIAGKTPDFISPITADTLLGGDPGHVESDFQASIQLDAALTDFDVHSKGRLRLRTVGKGDDVVELGTVTIKGRNIVPQDE